MEKLMENPEDAHEFANKQEILNRTEEEFSERKKSGSGDADVGKVEGEVRDKFYKEQLGGLESSEEQAFNLSLINKFHEKYPKVPQVEFEQKPCLIIPFEDGTNKSPDVIGANGYWVLTMDGIYTASFGTMVPESALNDGGKSLLKGIKDNIEYVRSDWHKTEEQKKSVKFDRTKLIEMTDKEPFIDMFELRKFGYEPYRLPVCELTTITTSRVGEVLVGIKDACESVQKKLDYIENKKDAAKKSKENVLDKI
jgi:hypothetical protein